MTSRSGLRAFVYLSLVFSFSLSANPACKDKVLASATEVTFGWEVEYVPGENPGLWNYYRPAQLSEAEWLTIPLADRDAWAKAHKAELAPEIRVPAKIVRLAQAPAYLPENLIVDETGNWEIIGGISDSYQRLEQELKETDQAVAPGSYQAHVVMPIGGLTRGAAGYTLFSADLLALRKWSSQMVRYRKDPKNVPGAFFVHPFLSVFTELKRDMLLRVINANMAGQPWQTIIPGMSQDYPELNHVWVENRPFYKYTLANTFRTDIYGNTEQKLIRFGYEVRSAHKSLDTLLGEVRTVQTLMEKGMRGFDSFLDIRAADIERAESLFTRPVVEMLQAVIPESEIEAPRWKYFAFIYRPLEQYATRLGLSEEAQKVLRKQILAARSEAVAQLQMLAAEYIWGTPKAEAKDQALLILAKFAEQTGLLEPMEAYLKTQVGTEEQLAKVSAN